eukprot:COSAG05_NODE_608_length_8372_cov_2.996615_7_plen_140_part_00
MAVQESCSVEVQQQRRPQPPQQQPPQPPPPPEASPTAKKRPCWARPPKTYRTKNLGPPEAYGRRPAGRPVSLRCGGAVVGNGPMLFHLTPTTLHDTFYPLRVEGKKCHEAPPLDRTRGVTGLRNLSNSPKLFRRVPSGS